MEDLEKNDVPIKDDAINLHDLLSRVKQEEEDSLPNSSANDVKYVFEKEIKSEIDDVDTEAGTSETTSFFCALCRHTVPDTVPSLVITPEAAGGQSIRDQLLRKYSTWTVDSMEMRQPMIICSHHLHVNVLTQGRDGRSVCFLCGNGKVLARYTTVIPADVDGQVALVERNAEYAGQFPPLLEELFALARQGALLKMCTDHVTDSNISIPESSLEESSTQFVQIPELPALAPEGDEPIRLSVKERRQKVKVETDEQLARRKQREREYREMRKAVGHQMTEEQRIRKRQRCRARYAEKKREREEMKKNGCGEAVGEVCTEEAEQEE